jgi:RNA polymerase sigma-70 factor (ECF subfamily)
MNDGDVNAHSESEVEAELVRAAKRGDHGAFEALVEKHGQPVLRYMRGMCLSHSDAEDLTQDAFFTAFRSLETFKDGTNFGAWLRTIAYHTWIRSRKKVNPFLWDQEKLDARAGNSPAVGDKELEKAFRAVLAALPEDQRTVVLLRFGENLSHSEIAKITGTEEATVRWRLYRARQKLRKVLKLWAPKKSIKGRFQENGEQ